MSEKYNKFIDKKFTKWTVKSYSHKLNTGHAFMNCVCECGNEVKVRLSNLVNGRSKQCVPCGVLEVKRINTGKNRSEFDPVTYTIRRLYKRYKSDARRRKFEFNISLEFFTYYISKNCHYCALEPKTVTNLTAECGIIRKERYDDGWIAYNGIDRVDPKRGYTKDNIVTCCEFCNRAKLDWTSEEFLEGVRRIYEHKIKK